MRRIPHLALHDTRLFLMQRENFFFMFGMPVLFMLFFSTVLGGSGNDPKKIEIALNVVNQDEGFLSTGFLRQLQAQNFDLQSDQLRNGPTAPARARPAHSRGFHRESARGQSRSI